MVDNSGEFLFKLWYGAYLVHLLSKMALNVVVTIREPGAVKRQFFMPCLHASFSLTDLCDN